jgi:hypothetical protein
MIAITEERGKLGFVNISNKYLDRTTHVGLRIRMRQEREKVKAHWSGRIERERERELG